MFLQGSNPWPSASSRIYAFRAAILTVGGQQAQFSVSPVLSRRHPGFGGVSGGRSFDPGARVQACAMPRPL
jgi:hypothetical protein